VANWAELRVAGGFFFCVFLALCFCSPVALASATPSSVSDDGGADVISGAAGDKAEWRWRCFQRWRERNQRESNELLFFSPVLLFFYSFLLFSHQFKSSPLCSSNLFSKWYLFLSQTIPCFLLSIRFSSSSLFLKIFAPLWFPYFSFSPPPLFFCAFLCIYRQLGRGSPYHVQVQGMGLRLIFLP